MQVVRFVDLTGEENGCAKCGLVFTDCFCVTSRPISPGFDLELNSDDDQMNFDDVASAVFSYFGSDSDSEDCYSAEVRMNNLDSFGPASDSDSEDCYSAEVIRNNLDSFGPAPDSVCQGSENAQAEVNQSPEEPDSSRKTAAEIVRQITTISMKIGQSRMRTQRGSQLPYRKFTYEEAVSLARARGDNETRSLLDPYSNYWRPSGPRRARN
jgi:hypothetical protein